MAFDPLAFLKSEKAFTIEGLLSRDMAERFMEDEPSPKKDNAGAVLAHCDMLDELDDELDELDKVLGELDDELNELDELDELDEL